MVYDGASRTEAARIGCVTLQIVRDWVVKLNAYGPDGLIDGRAPGQQSRLNDTHRAALAGAIESGPIPAVHGVVRWRIVDLCQLISDEFQVSVAKQTLSREPRAASCGRWATASRRRGRATMCKPRARSRILKKLPRPPGRDRARAGHPARRDGIWFADEASVGQRNTITRRWARRGERRFAPQDQRTASTGLFGAICPQEGTAAGLVLPWCNTEAMGLHLAEKSARVTPGRHCSLLLDQAG